MKKWIKSFLIFLLSAQFLINPLPTFSQTKSDILVMQNGEKKTGKVVSVGDRSIKFVHSGETLEYEFKKDDINKIEFASGRVELISESSNKAMATEKPATAQPVSTPEQRKNKIAVLPFEIVSNEAGLTTESMSKQVQAACINALRERGPIQTIQDPMVTNSILAKHDISAQNLAINTPQEWAELLGVEYVIMGTYSIENKGTTSSGSGYVTSDSKTKDEEKKKTTTYGSGTTSTSTNYDTHVSLKIYNDAGNPVFSETRSPAFGSIDSYNPALKHLMKRVPLVRN